MSLFKKAVTLLVGDDTSLDFLKVPSGRALKPLTERQLLRLESEIGSQLFGPVPAGHSRQFFCLDDHTWIWHEEWLDAARKWQSSTVRYEINEHGVLKVQDGSRYTYIEGDELKNFALSIRMYYERVARDVYRRDPRTAQKLV
jgi:hypothetical protein